MDGWRDRRLQPRQRRFDVIHRVDHVGAGLLEDHQDDAAAAVLPGGQFLVLRPVDRLADVAHPHRRAVAIGQNHVVELGRLGELVVVVQGVGRGRAVDDSLRCIHRRIDQVLAHILQCHAHRRELGGIDLHPDRALLLPADEHLRHARELGNLLRQHVVGVVVRFDQWQRVGLHRQDQNRRIRWIDFVIARHGGQILRQLSAGGIDLRLDVAGRGIDIAVKVELDGDLRRPQHTDRGHLGDARYLRELPLQRLCHRGCHGFRTGAGILGIHVDGRKLDPGQRRLGQERISGHADQHHRRDHEGGGDRSLDEGGGDAHGYSPAPV